MWAGEMNTFGSEFRIARANDDTADTTWDNLKVETVLGLSVVFEDDFSSNEIDPARYGESTPFFEGGIGDIHAEAGDGVMRFVGTTTQQWWSGGTLKIKDSFNAGQDSPVTISICLLYTSPSPRDRTRSRMPSSA